jgi:hypothetical protein
MDKLDSYTPEEQPSSITVAPSPRPCSSVYSDGFPLEELVHRVDESVRMAELSTIEQLEEENRALRNCLSRCRLAWKDSKEMFGEIMELTLMLAGTLEALDRIMTSAKRDWLASWGIGTGSEVAVWI